MGTKIQEQCDLCDAMNKVYHQIMDECPDAERDEDRHNWLHSESLTQAGGCTESADINGKTFYFKTYGDPSTAFERVYSTDGPIDTSAILAKLEADPKLDVFTAKNQARAEMVEAMGVILTNKIDS